MNRVKFVLVTLAVPALVLGSEIYFDLNGAITAMYCIVVWPRVFIKYLTGL